MRVVVLAYHDMGCAGLEVLKRGGDEIVAVYTHRDDPQEEVWFGSVAETARRFDLPVHFPDDINAPTWVEHVRQQAPDILFSFYYRRIVSPEILAIPPRGALNLHGSYLPYYRGRAPVNWVLVHGERETGVTLHYMNERADAGDIVAQRKIAIEPHDTAHSLHVKVVREGKRLLSEMLPAIREGTNPRTPQDQQAGSTFGRRRPEDGRIDWSRPAREVYDLVRAVTHPYPGAFTFLGGQRLVVWWARPESGASPGPGIAIPFEGGLRVGTGEGLLRLLSVQLEGGPETSAAELLIHRPLAAGTKLE
ncbi:MAG TPA: formyltransferase [Candidatus Polarisedimenticolaceae bacterium]|nr:formyltransferase [Candidatus Polarisedimenticolaceae bacterium]